MSERALIRLAGGLSIGGFLLFYVVTQLWHPAGQENNHPVIFTKYAESDPWVADHCLQFAGVLFALGGSSPFFTLSRGEDRHRYWSPAPGPPSSPQQRSGPVLQAVPG